jgi:hypothetical protein
MTFEQCAEMVRLSNKGCDSFYPFVEKHLGTIIGVQIDMLMNTIDLTKVEGREVFFLKLHEHLIDIIDGAGFRAQMRFEVLAQILGKKTEQDYD